jgi:hypothetical protein
VYFEETLACASDFEIGAALQSPTREQGCILKKPLLARRALRRGVTPNSADLKLRT